MSKQTGTRVAFQGERGAYSEMAAQAMLQNITPVPCTSFDAVFLAVEQGEVDLGLVPIENSLAGSVHRNYDLLLRHNLHIVGETQLRVEHCLIAHQGVKLDGIRTVRSHPQALAQCEQYLTDLGVQIEMSHDTAGAVRALRDSSARDEAAIASRLAANQYDMQVLAESIEDNKENFTRFLLLSTEEREAEGEVKTSIVFVLLNKPGVLFKALACFALRDIDLTKIESRPFPGLRWKYRFYLDFLGSQHTEPGCLALHQLTEMTSELRVLGTYPRNVWLNTGLDQSDV